MKIRLKSVQNMEKITKSMKMVSAAKFTHSERELKPARTYGEGASGMWPPLFMFMFRLVRIVTCEDSDWLVRIVTCEDSDL